MDTLNKLSELFVRFPGIGPRQAKRFVYFLLASPSGYREELMRLIAELRNIVAVCAECQRFFTAEKKTTLCTICANPRRDKELLMIVEKDVDLENIEKARAWSGTYFVLGGTIPVLEKNPKEVIRTKQLQKLLEERGKSKPLKEIVFALSLTSEGENTAEFLREFLLPLQTKYGWNISMLGRGLSTGSELEYSDPETIRNALKNRQ
ncbi:MAG TPA: toprim domain-containing protein [Candidatus Paceibacterota bacterium]